MTTKHTGKAHEQQQKAATPSARDMQMAHHAHTLAQMLYGQLATTQPWMAPMRTPSPMTPESGMFGTHVTPWTAHGSPYWGAGPMFGPQIDPRTTPLTGPMAGPMTGPFAYMSWLQRFPHW